MTWAPNPSANQCDDEGWVTSSYSSSQGACVEVKRTPAVVAVRDSKARSSGTLSFPTASWTTFLAAVKTDHVSVM